MHGKMIPLSLLPPARMIPILIYAPAHANHSHLHSYMRTVPVIIAAEMRMVRVITSRRIHGSGPMIMVRIIIWAYLNGR